MSSPAARRQAFTLLEILIVVIIIGILAALVIPQISGAAEDAKVSKVLAVVDTLRAASESHYADTSALAAEYSDSTNEFERELSIKQSAPVWKGPYLAHPLTNGDNPFGGVVRLHKSFTDGPVNPVGFDLIGRGTDTVTGAGQYVAFTNVGETAAKTVNDALDKGIGGNWRSSGRVEWSKDTLMIFVMDVAD